MALVRSSGTIVQRRLEWQVFVSALLGIAAGYVLPDPPFTPLITVALLLMLWPAMLDIELSDLRIIFTKPRVVILALLLNFLLSPLLIFALSRLFPPGVSPHVLAGILLFGIVPCGGMVPAYTGMSNGNVGLSVSLAALSLVLSVGLVPLWTKLLLGKIIIVPFALTASTIAVTLFLPMLAAWLIRTIITTKRGLGGFQQTKSSLKRFSGFGLMLMGFSVFAINGKHLAKNPSLMIKIAAVTFCFLTILLVCSVLLGKVARLNYADLMALTISSTAKNNALSLSLAVLLFNPETALSIAVAGPMVQIPVMLAFLRLSRRRSSSQIDSIYLPNDKKES